MSRAIKLVGLDCGSTTTSAVVAEAKLTTGALGRVEITDLVPILRSEMIFTPLDGQRLDAGALARPSTAGWPRRAWRPTRSLPAARW